VSFRQRLFLEPPSSASAVPIHLVGENELERWLHQQAPSAAHWVRVSGFCAKAGELCIVPNSSGGFAQVVVGYSQSPSMWDWAAASLHLPEGLYRLEMLLSPRQADQAALAWALASYRFERYRPTTTALPKLVWPEGCRIEVVERAAAAVFLARDLINTPADDLGPDELATAARDVAGRYGAQVSVIAGEALVAHNFPAVYAVGRASNRPPCLIDLRWGDTDAPKLTLVGKGVCFDTGGLDVKPASAMKLMKKDMGGAAITLALAQMVMDAALPVRLRLIIPAVDNAIAGNALRPFDIIRTRKGLTVEIGHTDAEGRVILADALAEAASEAPELLIDIATLTGAARVALGTELPALFCNDDETAEAALAAGSAVDDPLWRLPLWTPYRRHIKGKVADLTNAPDLPYAGAITAALFLAEFASPVSPWLHLDVMAWNMSAQPGRPEGGEAQALRALYALIERRYKPE